MKKIFNLTILTMLILGQSFTIVDDRDYPDDSYDVYLLGTHIGHYYADYYEFEYIRTGK